MSLDPVGVTFPAVRGKLLRCCKDTLRHDAPAEPAEGERVPCRWCLGDLLWQDGAWEYVSHLTAWIMRESSPDVTASRHAEIDRLTSGRFSQRLAEDNKSTANGSPFMPPRTMTCQRCGGSAIYCDTSTYGITTYLCEPARHISFVDHSRDMRRR